MKKLFDSNEEALTKLMDISMRFYNAVDTLDRVQWAISNYQRPKGAFHIGNIPHNHHLVLQLRVAQAEVSERKRELEAMIVGVTNYRAQLANEELEQERAHLHRLLNNPVSAGAEFHKRIKGCLSKRQQGLVMGAYREVAAMKEKV